MKKISLVIITQNEASRLKDCILSAQMVADEIIVYDSFSTDDTASIAEQMGAKVAQHNFFSFAEQRNNAMKLATNDWILWLDADERLSNELQKSIAFWKVNSKNEIAGYAFHRLNFYKNKAIKGCGWYPDKKLRLVPKTDSYWLEKNPHEELVLKSNASVYLLEGDLLHYTNETYLQLKNKAIHYANLAAIQLKKKSSFLLFIKMLLNSFFKFFKNYFFKKGFLYRKEGLEICSMQALETYLKYKKAIELKTKK